jgi:hypothetical protein
LIVRNDIRSKIIQQTSQKNQLVLRDTFEQKLQRRFDISSNRAIIVPGFEPDMQREWQNWEK